MVGKYALTLILTLLFFVPIHALKFEIPAAFGKGTQRCFSQYVDQEQLGVGNIEVKGDFNTQTLDVEVTDRSENRNILWFARNLSQERKLAFRTHTSGYVDFCFYNSLKQGFQPSPEKLLFISFFIDTGSKAQSPSGDAQGTAVSAKIDEALLPLQEELGRLESMIDAVSKELEFMVTREKGLRDVNESTNDRVKWVNLIGVAIVVGTAIYQVQYMRSFFIQKKLI